MTYWLRHFALRRFKFELFVLRNQLFQLNIMKIRPVHCLLLLCLVSLHSYSQKTLGLFQAQTDIGNPLKAGTAGYDPQKQVYTITGAGANMWSGHDEFHYVYKKLKGNFILRLRGNLIGKG